MLNNQRFEEKMNATHRATTKVWLTKVPAITATFWVIKVLSTTIGETFADFLSVNIGLGPAITDITMIAVLAVALTIQLRKRQYTPWIYWLCVVLISIVGTQITDFFTDTLGVSLYLSTPIFAVILAAVFTIWHRQEHTLAITSINTRRRELFYWAAILVTFALGTASGDLATEALSLGFRNGVVLFGGLILVVFIASRLGVNKVLTFWIAYILTRPLGASLGDLLTQDQSLGGIGLGATTTSIVFFAVIAVLVAREQLLVNRHGVAEKGHGPLGGRRQDFTWAGTGAAAVIIFGLILGATSANSADAGAPAAPSSGATATATAAGSPGAPAPQAVHPTTALGDLTKFSTIANDVQTKITNHDLAGAATRVKDLEIAWDSSEAGLKPRDPTHWHQLDDNIDGVLTSLRATPANQADCAANITTLTETLNTFNGV